MILGKSCPPTLQKRGCQGTEQCSTAKSTHHKTALKGNATKKIDLSRSVDRV